jgi:hypothetical protein
MSYDFINPDLPNGEEQTAETNEVDDADPDKVRDNPSGNEPTEDNRGFLGRAMNFLNNAI